MPSGSPYEIEEWEQIDPDDIHKMPVEPGQFHWEVILRGEPATPGEEDENSQDANSNNHVERVHTCHGEIERKKDLRMLGVGPLVDKGRTGDHMLMKLVGVFDDLDPKKHRAKRNGTQQESDQQLALADLGILDG